MSKPKRYLKCKPHQVEVMIVIPLTPDSCDIGTTTGGCFRIDRKHYGLGYWPPASGDLVMISSDPPVLVARPRTEVAS